MWGRRKDAAANAAPEVPAEGSLREAVRRTRIEMAEKSAVVVDLRDAELARIELLNEALDPLFKETPPELDLFDRGISRGDTPRLWIDAIAHVAMGRDKRRYRFLQDTRNGRKVLAESNDVAEMVEAVTHYVASRIVDRERALAADDRPLSRAQPRGNGGRAVWAFLLGLVVGGVALFVALWILATQLPD